MDRTKVSSKGQVVIPKPIREEHGWAEGTELEIERTPAGALLRSARTQPFARKPLDEVAGSLKKLYAVPAKSLDDMQKGIDEAMRERWERKRK